MLDGAFVGAVTVGALASWLLFVVATIAIQPIVGSNVGVDVLSSVIPAALLATIIAVAATRSASVPILAKTGALGFVTVHGLYVACLKAGFLRSPVLEWVLFVSVLAFMGLIGAATARKVFDAHASPML